MNQRTAHTLSCKIPGDRRITIRCAGILALSVLTGCSALPSEMQESLNDMRGSLPGPLRGDAKPLKDYPTATISGTWTDRLTPELAVQVTQNGANFTLSREGVVNDRTIRQRIEGTVDGRAVTAQRTIYDANELRPQYDECSGAVSEDNQRFRITCGNESLNFEK